MLRLATAYATLALVLLAPALARGELVGHPDVDLWNHVWGYWFVAEALQRGALPWHTSWLGAPDGGTLFFVDLPGALAGLPATWVLGPGVAWNLVILGRIAAAGFFAHLLAARVTGPGPHAALAGIAYATTPFLWCELANGISEVAATGWVPATLWAADRARSGRPRDALLLGALGGLSVWANFYYAATAALLVALGWLGSGLRGRLRPALLAGAVALALGAPAFAAIRASVEAPDALVRRSAALNTALAAHNAVDPRVYLAPGDFQSVDLARVYGEPFRHTGYLRWSVVLLAAMGAWRLGRGAARWVALAAVSLVLGLGPYLWWNGAFVTIGGHVLSLPFAWLQRLVPDLAITHPLRLSIGAQAIVCVLASAALVGQPRLRVAVLALLATLETAFGSAASWPIASSSPEIPRIYREIAADTDPRAVLDLPAEVGTTMATSRVFWLQTVHRRPVPYTPDARAGSARDRHTFRALFPHPAGRPGARAAFALPTLDSAGVAHLARIYGWIVVHGDWEARVGATGAFAAAIRPALGEPRAEGSLQIWRLPDAPAAR